MTSALVIQLDTQIFSILDKLTLEVVKHYMSRRMCDVHKTKSNTNPVEPVKYTIECLTLELPSNFLKYRHVSILNTKSLLVLSLTFHHKVMSVCLFVNDVVSSSLIRDT